MAERGTRVSKTKNPTSRKRVLTSNPGPVIPAIESEPKITIAKSAIRVAI